MPGETILIIDDNSTNLKLLRILLTVKGYEVHTAKDAEDALSILKNFIPRMILMDLQLPGMDGLELTRKLKKDATFKSTIIIAITAFAMKGDAERAIESGCDGYIAKPIDTDTLPCVLEQYLNRQPNTGE